MAITAPLAFCHGPAADAVLGIDGARALRGEVSAPGLAARPRGLRELLAMPVGALEPAEIGALAGSGAGDEECHTRLLSLRVNAHDRKRRYSRNGNRKCCEIHPGPPFSFVMAKRKRGWLTLQTTKCHENSRGSPVDQAG